MSNDEYFRPTPVIITSNTYIWNLCPSAKGAILPRLIHFYGGLKSCPLLENITYRRPPFHLAKLLCSQLSQQRIPLRFRKVKLKLFEPRNLCIRNKIHFIHSSGMQIEPKFNFKANFEIYLFIFRQ